MCFPLENHIIVICTTYQKPLIHILSRKRQIYDCTPRSVLRLISKIISLPVPCFRADQDFGFRSGPEAGGMLCESLRLTWVRVSSLQLCSGQLKWRIINSDGWLSARSDWTILRADQFPASAYRCWWWVTQLIITRESMPWILFSLPALRQGDTATLLHRRCILHTHTRREVHTDWPAMWSYNQQHSNINYVEVSFSLC